MPRINDACGLITVSEKKMRKSLIVLLCLYPSVLFAAEYPSFLNVEIGEPFSHLNALDNKDSDRPTTQFRVPNHGPSSNLFHEYSVAYINADNTVAIVTAERATESWTECSEFEIEAATLAEEAFPGYESTPIERQQLGSGEFSLKELDKYYVLRCESGYGPFVQLHFQIRSKTQDAKLKAAWGEFFEAQNR